MADDKAAEKKDDQPSPIPTPTLPKGGGAISGMGEKFTTSPATGTGSMSVPIFTSPGRGGFHPELALAYDSGSGNGPFGLGWSLSVPSISRKTDKGLPRYRDGEESDVFILSGAEDLVPVLVQQQNVWAPEPFVDDGDQVYRYRPRVEGLFARIERRVDLTTGNTYWRAITRDNLTSIYGKSAAARVADPANPSHVFRWLLEETRDGKGNVIAYEYKAEDAVGVPARPSERNRSHNNIYLKRIHYANATPDDASAFHLHVVFDYGEHDEFDYAGAHAWPARQDPFSTYRAAFEVRTHRLCRRVMMFHEFPELGNAPVLVGATELQYDEGPLFSFLRSAQRVGYRDDGTKDVLPALSFGYTEFAVQGTVQTLDRDTLAHLRGGVDGKNYRFTDLDSEGLPGILFEQPEAWLYKHNLGGGTFGPLERIAPRPTSTSQELVDFAGDGQKYLVQLATPPQGYYRRNANGKWDAFARFRSVPNIDFRDPNLRYLDLDGDGLADILVSETDVFRWYPSQGTAGYGAAEVVRNPLTDERGPRLVLAEEKQTIFIADMTGDGLPDLVRIRNGSVCYWPNLGYGHFGKLVTMDAAPVFDTPDVFDPSRIRLGDIDGSGTTDILYLGADGARFWSNLSGNGFSDARLLRTAPPANSQATATLVDLLGTGTACLVWSSPLPGAAPRTVRFIDLAGSVKPHLLNTVDNHLGATTTIAYVPSTKFYLADQAAGKPWVTKLPFPVQVVERVTVEEAVTGTRLVTSYSYHHGHYDGVEREFRGFGRVEQTDAETIDAFIQGGGEADLHTPPILTKSWFHTGVFISRNTISRHLADEYWPGDQSQPQLPDTQLPPDLTPAEAREALRALRGRMLHQQVYGLDGNSAPYAVTEQNFTLVAVQPMGKRHAVFVAYPREAVQLHYERSTSDPRMTHDLTLAVDPYGNVTQSASVAYPRRVPAYDEQGKIAVSYVEHDVANVVDQSSWYRIGVPIESRSYEIHGVAAQTGLYPFGAIAGFAATQNEIEYEAQPTGAVEKRLLKRERQLYWSDALTGALALGQVESRALPYETHKQALTPGLVALYGNRVDNNALQSAGYFSENDGSWWALSPRQSSDPALFYQASAFRDPFGNVTTVGYDYALLVKQTTDALSNQVTAVNDFRHLAPSLVTDANDNRAAAGYDGLGRVLATALMGKDGENVGDTLDAPTTRAEYHLEVVPAYSHVSARETHGDPNTRWQETYSYTDGLGREVMKKVLAEPGDAHFVDENGQLQTQAANPRWIGTGRTVFDNKGHPVKQYEPFFSTTFAFETEKALVEWGVTPILHYDPLGRLIRTDRPNGTFATVELDAWRSVSADENDNVLSSQWYADRSQLDPSDPEARAAQLAAAHANTPTVTHADSLGRTFLTIADNKTATFETRLTLDIEGQQRIVTDARGIACLTQDFDMAGHVIHAFSTDAGDSMTLFDVLGQPCQSWDARNIRKRRVYDPLRRTTHLWVDSGNGETLAERTLFGETHPAPKPLNLRTRAYRQLDGAGLVTNASYDFKGNLLSSSRNIAVDFLQVPDWHDADQVQDPTALPQAVTALLATEHFDTSREYDALNRVTLQTTPDASETRPTYNEAGLLERIEVTMQNAVTPYVQDVDYNEKGQRLRILYGNGVVTTYTYDPTTFRLTRLLSTRPNNPNPLQDLSYTYDPVGNIMQIADAAQRTIYFQNEAVPATAQYVYDATYRLTQATGREHVGQNGSIVRPDSNDAWLITNIPEANDQQAMRLYTESYDYDSVGNILQMTHRAPDQQQASWTRRYQYANDSNRLTATTDDNDQFNLAYNHDAAGNITLMSHLPTIVWDHANRMVHANRGNPGEVYYYFTYDSSGQRIRKVTADEDGNLKKERTYVGGYEVYREYSSGSLSLERQSLHVLDGQRRASLVETKTFDQGAIAQPVPLPRYQLDNYLGSACVELDDQASVITYEEYYPYGTTAYRAVANGVEVSAKRFRYIGTERDDETGLYYHGARYCANWLSRWISPDATGLVDGPNLYLYVLANPIRLVDRGGTNAAVAPIEAEQRMCLAQTGCAQSAPPPKQQPYTAEQRERIAAEDAKAAGYSADAVQRQIAVAEQDDAEVGPLTRRHVMKRLEIFAVAGEANWQQGHYLKAIDYKTGAALNALAFLIVGETEKDTAINVAVAMVTGAAAGRVLTAISSSVRGMVSLRTAPLNVVLEPGAVKGPLNPEALNLQKQLASEMQANELLAGGGEPMAGAGGRKPIDDLPRLMSDYGGAPEDWSKIRSSNFKAADGTSFEVHAYRNIRTGEVVELKTKFQ